MTGRRLPVLRNADPAHEARGAVAKLSGCPVRLLVPHLYFW
jgi:hypothetical protein